MGWPFRRKKHEPTRETAGAPVAPAAPAVRTSSREWAGLPPLAPVVARKAPLTLVAATSVYDVSTLQPLVHDPAPLPAPAPPDAPIGVVQGLAQVVPAAGRDPHQETALVHAAAPGSTAPATEESWALPEVEVPVRPVVSEPPATGGAGDLLRFTDDLPMVQLAPPPPVDAPSVTPQPAAPVAPVGRAVEVAPEVDDPAVEQDAPARRLNLGESRRLGLGPPFRGALPEDAAPIQPAAMDVELVPAPEPVPRPVPSDAPAPVQDDTPPPRLGLGAPLRQQPPPPPDGPRYRPSPEAPARPLPLLPPDVVVERPAAPSEPEAMAPPTAEPVPGDIRRDLANAFGVDVGDRPVERGPAATAEAQRHGARAVTRDAQVFMPSTEGPLASPGARGVLAHELTHVAQQRAHGPSLPAPDTAAGRALEAAAQVAERYYRGDPGAPPPGPDLVHPEAARPSVVEQADPSDYVRRVADGLVEQGLAHRDGTGSLVFGPSAGSVTAGVQALTGDAPSTSAWDRFRQTVGGDFDRTMEESAGTLINTNGQGARQGSGSSTSRGVQTGTTSGTSGIPTTTTDQHWSLDEEQEVQERIELRLLQLNQELRAENIEPVPELPVEEQERIRAEVVARRERSGSTGQTGPGTGHPTGGATGPGGGRGPGGAGGRGTTAPTAPTVPVLLAGEHADARSTPGFGERFGHLVAGGFAGAMQDSVFGMFSFGQDVQKDIDQERRWEEYNWQRREQGLPNIAFERFVQLEREGGGTAGAPGTNGAATTSGTETGRSRSGAVSGAAAGAVAAAAVASLTDGHGGPGADLGAPRSGRRSPHSGREQLDPEDFDLEELADRLYDRMRARMRTELIVDRERAGLLTDFR